MGRYKCPVSRRQAIWIRQPPWLWECWVGRLAGWQVGKEAVQAKKEDMNMPALGRNMEDWFRGVRIQVADSLDVNVLDRDKDTRQIGARHKGVTSKYGGTKGQNRAEQARRFLGAVGSELHWHLQV